MSSPASGRSDDHGPTGVNNRRHGSLVVLSDLHLGPNRSDVDTFRHDAEFAALLRHLAEGAAFPTSGPPPTLLILGDFLELPGGLIRGQRRLGQRSYGLDQLCDLLDAIAAAHAVAFTALASYLAAGAAIEIVPGNHDPALAVPDVADHLRHLLNKSGRPAGTGQLRVNPWYLRRRGVFHAEHGHQFHDINAVLAPWRPWQLDQRNNDMPAVLLEDRLGSVFHRANSGGREPVARIRSLVDLTLTALSSAVAARSLGSHPRASDNERLRDLGPDVIEEIAALSPTTVRSVITRLTRRLITEQVPPEARPTTTERAGSGSKSAPDRDAYLVAGARKLHHTLAARRLDTPIYLFGHTHVPRVISLGDQGQRPWYANPGSWSTWSPLSGAPGLPYLVVPMTEGQGVERPELQWWPKLTMSRSPAREHCLPPGSRT